MVQKKKSKAYAHAKNDARTAYAHAQEDTAKAMEAARKQARKTLADARVKFRHAEKVVDKKIQTHPEQAVLIAAGIGAVAGALATYSLMLNRGKKK